MLTETQRSKNYSRDGTRCFLVLLNRPVFQHKLLYSKEKHNRNRSGTKRARLARAKMCRTNQ